MKNSTPEQASILVVDDDQANRTLLESILSTGGYAVRVAASGEEALAAVAQQLPDLILLDILLPDIDGFEVTRRLRADSRNQSISIILVTVLEDRESRLKGLEAGANEFLSKPVDYTELLTRVKNQLKVKEFTDFLADHNRILEEQVSERTAKLRQLLEQTVTAIALTLEKRDPYTAGHQRRVAQLAAAIGEEMGLARTVIEGIHFGGLIHDIGKISVPAEILSKPVRLSDLEFKIVKVHAEAGYEILKDIAFPWPVADMVRQHHERMDGSGYPQGLKGEQIMLEARILAVADVTEAMSARRPYRPGLGMDAALEEITRGRGSHFDPAAVDACLRIIREKGFVFSL